MRSHHYTTAALILLLACSSAEKPKAPLPEVPARSPAATEAGRQLQASLDEFNRRKVYRRLSIDVLVSIADDKLEQAIVDFIAEKTAANGGDERKTLQELSVGFRAVYATWIVEAEVNNGGFNQFFWNSSGDYAADAVDGFTRVGAPQLAVLMRRAIEVHKKQAARLNELKKRGTLEDFSESYEDNALNDLDEQFFKSGVDVSALRVKFIRANPTLFIAD